ncbi:hypothetical protein [Winogradskya humida]|uniref:Uncharacterized protein n=1 Tax=Winogradskya humida TaxID=113566 RepID=A0ABQ3ZEM6_9ACTN|nr:hypothetical protein [Actinoplanes humidus]GIE16973.1 hypothetical protein Ahu01nite_000750 [Actinoplanes humidus]
MPKPPSLQCNDAHRCKGAVADPAVVEEAFTVWREQIAAADQWLDSPIDLDELVTIDGRAGQ